MLFGSSAAGGEQETRRIFFEESMNIYNAYTAARALARGMIRGVGPATAKLLIRAFGEKTLDVLYSEPERLLEVSGIGEKRARMIQESYAEQAQQREAMVFLQSYGVTPALAVKIYKRYGENVRQVITRNPYRLVEDVEGIGFKTADRIAASLGIEQDSEYRLSAGVKYTLSDATAVAGHCYLPRPELALAARRILGNDPDLIERTIDSLILSHEIAAQILPGDDDEDVVALYLPSTYRAESEVARRLREMIDAMPDTMATDLSAQIDELERVEGIAFHAQQRQAIETAVTSGMTVITGGPGTGKTTIIKCIIKLLSVHGDIALAAPTGRAAKRMSELTGRSAQTIHRLLEAGMSDDHQDIAFRRDEDDPLECDAVILDECSMVDISLMCALLRAMRPECRLILVGDADQLPSVGPGNVFSDIIRSGVVPTVRLTEIFRQAAGSSIVSYAHAINRGEHPNLAQNSGDFFFLRRTDPQKAADTVVELCKTRLPNNMKIPPSDIQVLTPTRKYDTGMAALNVRLQAALNPPSPEKKERRFGETVFREGDRVMQIRNDYDIVLKNPDGTTAGTGVYNGDVGQITAIDPQTETLSVCYDGKTATYGFEMLNELEHAWVMTVHKSQGSEYRAVVLCIGRAGPMLLTRSVLYTAITRAKSLLIIVGDEGAAYHMIDNQTQTRRYSGLRARLCGECGAI